MIILWIALAGGLGALARFIVDGLLRTVLGRRFPWGTLIINSSGSLLLGIITGIAVVYQAVDLRLIVGIGFCGGFTTFSTASFETVRLLQNRRFFAAIAQSLGNAVLSIAAAFIGIGMVY